MPVIEFVGMPCSGKTYYCNLIKKKILNENLEIFTYTELFYTYVNKIIKLNTFETFLLNFSFKLYRINQNNFRNKSHISLKKELIKYNNSHIKKIIKSHIKLKVEKIKDKIILNLPRKEKKIFKLLKDSVNKSPISKTKKKELLSRLKEEIIGIFMYKKLNFQNKVVLNDEGLIQRILSGLFFENEISFTKIDEKIKSLFNYHKFDLILFVDASLRVLKNRSNKRRNGFVYKDMKNENMKNWQEVFAKFYNNHKKKIYKIRSKNNLNLLNSIIKTL